MTPADIKARFERHEGRIAALEKSQTEMVIAVDEIKKDTSEIVGILRDMHGAWRVFEFVGKAAKPIAWFAAMVAAAGVLWAQVTGHKP